MNEQPDIVRKQLPINQWSTGASKEGQVNKESHIVHQTGLAVGQILAQLCPGGVVPDQVRVLSVTVKQLQKLKTNHNDNMKVNTRTGHLRKIITEC